MLNIAIVDDEHIFIDTLIDKITDCCNLLWIKYTVDKYSNGYSILENYKKYHIIFLDIEMPFIDGITVAEKINELKNQSEFPYFVFITSHDELVFDALSSFPYSFIRKSDINNKAILQNCFIKLSQVVENKSKTIRIRTNKQDIVLKISDIIYIVKLKNYSYIHTASEKYSVKSSLKEYENILSKDGFIRCHEGYIVNLNEICKILDKSILLSNNEVIPISRSKVNLVKEAFMKRIVYLNG